jgi:hypothetical protein
MAFFAVHRSADAAGRYRFGAMALTIALLTLAYCLTLVGLGHAVTAQVKAHRPWLAAERLAGLVLVAFGISSRNEAAACAHRPHSRYAATSFAREAAPLNTVGSVDTAVRGRW